ncbi:MarR family winged helix-turn-helix transcriptional regulator [Amycolatopsis orientalis]|uniref:MarR family transcriptional regulator n=1 Tax=Amycolatopsis orientalis TaxID=31958 RepID=A0A193C4E6_AMYOR|nr:MarR family transcriptional regulator [Amycolatopsis orientalis]ANN19220.1 MarR family transcriptional regulator [Amycolatopsis orientalis]
MSDVAEQDLLQEWHTLSARHAAVFGLLECRLQERHGLGVTEFEALERLVNCVVGKCRAADLTEVVHLSQSATSRLVARLEREGLVQRALCESDRRGIFVVVTDEGRRRYEEAKPTHRSTLEETLAGA